MPQIAKVAVAAATYAIDKPYDYLIPQGTDIAVGMRVLAPFGRGNRVSEGVVLALGQGVPDKPIKPIHHPVLDLPGALGLHLQQSALFQGRQHPASGFPQGGAQVVPLHGAVLQQAAGRRLPLR